MSRSKIPKDELRELNTWYYDANTLRGKESYAEFLNADKYGHKCILSHLCLGEALGNAIQSTDEDAVDDLVELLDMLERSGFIAIHGNNGIEEELEAIRDAFRHLDLTDSVHLATALHFESSQFITTDPDFGSEHISKKSLQALCERLGCQNCTIGLRKL